jgi:hypothetical protein
MMMTKHVNIEAAAHLPRLTAKARADHAGLQALGRDQRAKGYSFPPIPTPRDLEILNITDAVDEISDLLAAVFELAGGFSAESERGLTRVISVAHQKLDEVRDALGACRSSPARAA